MIKIWEQRLWVTLVPSYALLNFISNSSRGLDFFPFFVAFFLLEVLWAIPNICLWTFSVTAFKPQFITQHLLLSYESKMRGHNLPRLWFPVAPLEHLIASWIATPAVPLVVSGDLQLKHSIWGTAVPQRMEGKEADCDSWKQFIITYVSCRDT